MLKALKVPIAKTYCEMTDVKWRTEKNWGQNHKKIDKQEADIILLLFIHHECTQILPGIREKQQLEVSLYKTFLSSAKN